MEIPEKDRVLPPTPRSLKIKARCVEWQHPRVNHLPAKNTWTIWIPSERDTRMPNLKQHPEARSLLPQIDLSTYQPVYLEKNRERLECLLDHTSLEMQYTRNCVDPWSALGHCVHNLHNSADHRRDAPLQWIQKHIMFLSYKWPSNESSWTAWFVPKLSHLPPDEDPTDEPASLSTDKWALLKCPKIQKISDTC